MFFHHLKNFSPYSGHIYDEMRTPYIKKKEGFLGRNASRFDLIDRLGYFPFKELKRDGRAYFISEADLYDFLTSDEKSTDENYIIDYPGWDAEKREIVLKGFLSGFDDGIIEFERNIGLSYQSLTLEQKTQYLEIFCLFCLNFLFFDGDLDKGLLYNLGYLQANLYRGFVEINNLKSSLPGGNPGLRLHFESYRKVLDISKAENQEKQLATVDTPSLIIQPRIELMCNLDEISAVWRVLTAPMKTKDGIQDAVFSAKQVKGFLGSAFSSGAFPEAFKPGKKPFKERTPKGDMRMVLNALMYATFRLNDEHNRSVKLIEYATSLIQHFPVFSGSTAESIKGVITNEARKGMEVLKKSLSVNPYIEEMLSILKKHKI